MAEGHNLLNGRNLNELKQLHVDLGVTSSYPGSSLICSGNTKLKCSVNLPKPSNKKCPRDLGLLNIEICSSDPAHSQNFLGNLKSILLDTFERNLILKNYQRLIIEAYIVILEDDGGIVPTATIGLSLAFVDAGIHMYDIISSCSIFTFVDEGVLKTTVHLSSTEEEYYSSKDEGFTALHLSYCPNTKTIAYFQYTGSHIEPLPKMLSMAENACGLITDQLVAILKEYNNRKSQHSNIKLQTQYISPNI